MGFVFKTESCPLRSEFLTVFSKLQADVFVVPLNFFRLRQPDVTAADKLITLSYIFLWGIEP